MASILPRSTSTPRGSLPCWMTPATMSPSRPAYSPKVSSSSTSRRRCRMTWRAGGAAIRPHPAGGGARQDGRGGGGRRDPAEPGRGVVVLLDHRAVRAGLDGPDRDVAALAVHLDARGGRRALGLVVRDEQRVLDGLDRLVQRD